MNACVEYVQFLHLCHIVFRDLKGARRPGGGHRGPGRQAEDHHRLPDAQHARACSALASAPSWPPTSGSAVAGSGT